MPAALACDFLADFLEVVLCVVGRFVAASKALLPFSEATIFKVVCVVERYDALAQPADLTASPLALAVDPRMNTFLLPYSLSDVAPLAMMRNGTSSLGVVAPLVDASSAQFHPSLLYLLLQLFYFLHERLRAVVPSLPVACFLRFEAAVLAFASRASDLLVDAPVIVTLRGRQRDAGPATKWTLLL